MVLLDLAQEMTLLKKKDENGVGDDNVGDDTDVEDDNDVGGEDGGEDLAE